jgi:hypothetical protein
MVRVRLDLGAFSPTVVLLRGHVLLKRNVQMKRMVIIVIGLVMTVGLSWGSGALSMEMSAGIGFGTNPPGVTVIAAETVPDKVLETVRENARSVRVYQFIKDTSGEKTVYGAYAQRGDGTIVEFTIGEDGKLIEVAEKK